MLNKKRTKTAMIGKYLLFVPAIAFTALLVNCTSATEEVNKTETPADNEVVVVSNNKPEGEANFKATPAQNTAPTEIDGQPVFDVVDNMPSYPGGMPAMMQYIATTIKYPEEAQKSGAKGRVIVKFIVNKDGKVSDITVARGIDPALDAEAVRVVKGMPNWTPATQKGVPVNVKYTIPVLFKLD